MLTGQASQCLRTLIASAWADSGTSIDQYKYRLACQCGLANTNGAIVILMLSPFQTMIAIIVNCFMMLMVPCILSGTKSGLCVMHEINTVVAYGMVQDMLLKGITFIISVLRLGSQLMIVLRLSLTKWSLSPGWLIVCDDKISFSISFSSDCNSSSSLGAPIGHELMVVTMHRQHHGPRCVYWLLQAFCQKLPLGPYNEGQ